MITNNVSFVRLGAIEREIRDSYLVQHKSHLCLQKKRFPLCLRHSFFFPVLLFQRKETSEPSFSVKQKKRGKGRKERGEDTNQLAQSIHNGWRLDGKSRALCWPETPIDCKYLAFGHLIDQLALSTSRWLEDRNAGNVFDDFMRAWGVCLGSSLPASAVLHCPQTQNQTKLIEAPKKSLSSVDLWGLQNL